MFDAAFARILLEVLLALLLLVAAAVDIRTLTISNRLNLVIAGLAPLYWVAAGLPLWPGVAVQVVLAIGLFILFAATFYVGLMGGGDVKLAAALALWFSPAATVKFLVFMSLAGGLLTLFVLAWHRSKGRPGKPEIPYGVAIAAGGLAILTQRFLNHFV
jgi:prepilin peptidase CpaA